MERVLIVGIRKTGIDAALFLKSLKKKVFCFDDSWEKVDRSFLKKLEEAGIEKLQKEDLDLNLFDTCVVSPGVPNSHLIFQLAKNSSCEIISEIELGFRYLDAPCIAVTGTNGKTTMTELITYVLNMFGMPAVSLGNIGKTLTSHLMKKEKKIVVLELSSYQLEKTFSKKIDFALLLNITPDHLNRYTSFQSYAEAKLRLLDLMKDPKNLFVDNNTAENFQLNDAACSIVDGEKEIDFLVPLLKHFGVGQEQIQTALKSFKKPSHRIEHVDFYLGARWINDSKSTNPASTLFALKECFSPIILIAGGDDKKLDYSVWNHPDFNKVKKVILMGKGGQKIKSQLNHYDMVEATDLLDAVKKASTFAVKDDTVLLSPGCSSLDDFANYEERGNLFKQYVRELKKELV
ncbi:MAG TPA: UDP-N-acetylmuramoyl-L-alanine--D-glutamate ligase [Chlamydiales bacterium]|nr:UDP-N-acetylmuramoyl-L-alanine--D-glutamate ligase [Chlamydiales bacterium]